MRDEDILKPSKSVFLNNSNLNAKDEEKGLTYKTGTTTVGLICKDAVILATDKRASMAYFVSSKTAEKLHMVQDYLYMTIAGSVADALYLVDILRAETSLYQLTHEKTIKVKSAARLLSNILYQNKLFPFEVGLILGGVTEEEGPTLLDIGAYGSILSEKFCAVGSGQNFSYGVLEAKYKDNLSVKEGKDIVIKAVTSSIIRDMASGNGIDIAVIKKEGPAEREFISIKE
ncbi:MAG: archaeal proteasome endopeptidase complex subunit beta [Candidatus Hodarchaeota archaeon]